MLALWRMQPNLAQVLNTLAHEIRTPLAVSQGYLKLYLDGRLTNADDTRRAMEQTRQALGALATLCVDMGKVSALADATGGGTIERVTATQLLSSVREQSEIANASWQDEQAWPGEAREGDAGAIETSQPRDLAHAVALVASAAFDEARGEPHAVRTALDDDLVILAGAGNALEDLAAGPAGERSRPVNFMKGGKGLKLIWAAFVLDRHRAQTWTHQDHRASVGIRIPLVQA